MSRIFRVRKDPFDVRDHLAMRSLALGPATVSMKPGLGPVRDQGASGSCTGQSGAGWLDWLYGAFTSAFPTKLVSPAMFSALFLYAQERMKNGTFPADDGSDSRTLFQVLNQLGVCPDPADPFIDTAIGQAPTAPMDAAAYSFRIGAYHRVLFDEGLATAKSVLASGYCRTIGIPVYKAIESDEVAETGLLPLPARFETPVGGHELLVYGYDDTKGVELARNSWGSGWGLEGDLMIPYGYYDAAGGNETCDSWTGHMGRPWVPKTN
jgi:hypothetical protein